MGVGVRQPCALNVLVKKGGDQAGHIRQRRAAVEDAFVSLEGELAPALGRGHHHGGHQVVAIGIEHTAGIGGELDGAQTALPRRLNPYRRLVAEHFRPLGEQNVRIVCIARQRQHGAQLLNAAGLRAAKHLAAETAAAPHTQLLFHQAALGVHIFGKAHIDKAAVFLPQLFMADFFHLVIQTHSFTLPVVRPCRSRRGCSAGSAAERAFPPDNRHTRPAAQERRSGPRRAPAGHPAR